MTRHIDQQRTELLVRRDQINAAFGPEADLPEHIEAQLDELNAALAKLDEVARLGAPREYPRLKVRKIDAARLDVLGLVPEHDGRWLVSVRHELDDEREQVLGTLADLPTAYSAATEYVAVQRFLADRLAHPHGAGL